MRITILLLTLSLPVSAQLYEKINGNPSMVKKIYLLPYKKNKVWVPGKVTSEFETYYDREGKPVKELEKSSGQIILQKNYIYRGETETQQSCQEAIKKTEKDTSFTEVQENAFSDTCKKHKNKKMRMKVQYNISPQEKSPRPFKTFLYVETSGKSIEYVFDADLNMEYKLQKSVDKKNQISEESKTDQDGKQIEKTLYKYSSQPLSVLVKYFDENDLLKKEILKEYRADNTLRIQTETSYDNLEQIFSKNIVECDTSGFPLNEKQYNQNGALEYEISYSYEYDEKANWTQLTKSKKRIVYGKAISDEIPPEMFKREIKYY
ncbi:MAG: hypothetical protein Fur0012_11550 [Elusimicrobiota bacterium]